MYILRGFILKLIMTTVIVTVVFHLFSHFPLAQTLLLSLLFTLIAYMGDLFIMPRISAFLAASTDLLLAFFALAFLGRVLYHGNDIPWLPAFVAALFITIGEFFFHRYLLEQMEANRSR